ncbi:hypothetical protein RJT34_25039 [Clitoria ternatea]|uniref:Uncharacterized protein n=1 Tax=Clitoria ternatea TaxID=43366 RepID=A0AAN9FP09_CLITE
MESSTVHLPKMETTTVWTDEKHLHFLATLEASFVRTMLHHYAVSTPPLPLDRHLPDTSESTLDSTKHAHSDSMRTGSRMASRRTKRRSSQRQHSSAEQAVTQLDNGRKGGTCMVGADDKTGEVMFDVPFENLSPKKDS